MLKIGDIVRLRLQDDQSFNGKIGKIAAVRERGPWPYVVELFIPGCTSSGVGLSKVDFLSANELELLESANAFGVGDLVEFEKKFTVNRVNDESSVTITISDVKDVVFVPGTTYASIVVGSKSLRKVGNGS